MAAKAMTIFRGASATTSWTAAGEVDRLEGGLGTTSTSWTTRSSHHRGDKAGIDEVRAFVTIDLEATGVRPLRTSLLGGDNATGNSLGNIITGHVFDNILRWRRQDPCRRRRQRKRWMAEPAPTGCRRG